MKRHGGLWPHITDLANLLDAARQARRGKRHQANVLDFDYHLESNLIELQDELRSQTYQPGPYTTFHIVEPKKRMISAAPYRDRVVHHALCNVIAPIFEAGFTDDSYGARGGCASGFLKGWFFRLARVAQTVQVARPLTIHSEETQSDPFAMRAARATSR
jgi:retron-type reverse transcriptase